MRWSRVALPVYWLALIGATHYPHVPIPGEIPQSDKVIHFGAFGLLAFLVWQVLATRTRPLTSASVWVAALISMTYAIVDEYTQQFTGRYTDVADAVADLLGIMCVLTVLEIRRRIRAQARDRDRSR